MSGPISVIIPHKSTPFNDQALELNLRMLRDNTRTVDCEIIVIENHGDPYRAWNRYADVARHEALVFTSSDMLMAPGWDLPMLAELDDNTIVTGRLVESGVVKVNDKNYDIDFGRRPDQFNRSAFETFAAAQVDIPEAVDGSGWYQPLMLTRSFFQRMGKYPCAEPFPAPNDMYFWQKCQAAGARFRRVRSFCYHFQLLSFPEYDHKRVST